MTLTADNLVAREVHYCVSSLVSQLAQAANSGSGIDMGDLGATMDQAFELACPIDDYEEAAIQAGWRMDADGVLRHPDGVEGTTWESVCDHYGIEPYQREVFEHWIVSDWLADKLAEKGEKIDKDFAGMTIWARTTTGQGIASDSVIAAIVADLNAAV
jgi:hypothetical protein